MSLDSFTGFDAGEGMSEAAFEAFKEKMRAAAAQIAAIKKEEGKQKKKEEELHKVLLKFIQHSHKRDLALLISRALEQNLPANFILAIILLGNEDIQREVGKYIMLQGGDSEKVAAEQVGSEKLAAGNPGNSQTGSANAVSGDGLIFFDQADQSLPLKIKIEVDNWIKNILFQAQENPQKLVKNAYDIQMIELESESTFDEPKYEQKKEIKPILVQLPTFILRDFLEQNKIDEPYSKLAEFSRFIIDGILVKVGEMLENMKFLGGEVSPAP